MNNNQYELIGESIWDTYSDMGILIERSLREGVDEQAIGQSLARTLGGASMPKPSVASGHRLFGGKRIHLGGDDPEGLIRKYGKPKPSFASGFMRKAKLLGTTARALVPSAAAAGSAAVTDKVVKHSSLPLLPSPQSGPGPGALGRVLDRKYKTWRQRKMGEKAIETGKDMIQNMWRRNEAIGESIWNTYKRIGFVLGEEWRPPEEPPTPRTDAQIKADKDETDRLAALNPTKKIISLPRSRKKKPKK